MKLKNIKKLVTLKIDTANVYGGWDGILATGSGSISGMDYESDIHVDSNGDGKWSSGESVHFYHTTPSIDRI
ncbi:hypothetical protein IMCC3317_40720 [Kordia antarctica]|uniref:Uncharacterized protein n=1 Tax=Kordia antarctica TaxID=1218801 RepID=A0A7L4ZPL9_9FLAO|nr:hypothetical protein [Kordia antarctica]QHI38678.1 hypothetical protein IMCC3317_40720 [Kordia antarctica]